MFVTQANFQIPPYQIPNLSDVSATFDQYIAEQEEDVLRSIMGNLFYEAFVAGLALDPIPERWQKLRDGESFTALDGLKYKWVGLTKTLTPYIYSQWLRDNYDTLTSTGVVVSKNENSDVINPSLRIAQSFNKFSGYIGGEYAYNWLYFPCIGRSYSETYNTLFEYLYAKHEDFNADVTGGGYGDFHQYLLREFMPPGKMNIFNI
jgi:hypothetical protein